MTPLETYKQFLLRINKNDTNKNINVPRGEFVLLFNEQRLKWLDDIVKDKVSTDEIEDIAELYKPDTELTLATTNPLFSEFTLPTDYFRRTSVYCLASKGECTNNVMVAWDFKPKNKDFNIQNSNEDPSFEYQETKYSIKGATIVLYKKDFNIDKVFLSYYSQPIALDIAGYKRLDGSTSVDQATDLVDINVGEVLDRCAAVVLGRYQNVEGFQLAAAEVAKSKQK